MDIQMMTDTDLEAVSAIENEVFSSPWSQRSFADAMNNKDNIYIVAKADQKVVGYCGLWTSFDTADLCNMAVNPRYRRHSVGEKLLAYGIKLAVKRNVREILLEVRKSNTAAITLYHKMKFKEIGVRKNYYSSPTEDALLLQLPVISTIHTGDA